MDQEKENIQENRNENANRTETKKDHRGSWTGGILLMAIGALLLLQNLGTITYGRWWALLILIPITAAAVNAFHEYRKADNHLNARAISSLIGASVLTTVMVVLYFNLRWDVFGPVIMVLIGLGIVLRNTVRPATKKEG